MLSLGMGARTVCRYSPPSRADARRRADARIVAQFLRCSIPGSGPFPGEHEWHTRHGSDLRTRAPPRAGGFVFAPGPGPADRAGQWPSTETASVPAPIRSQSMTPCWPVATAPRRRPLPRLAVFRLEHLLHALTRVGAAADVLTELGIRVDTLRRDTAVAIAAEIPAGVFERRDAALLRRIRGRAAARCRPGRQAARPPAGLHDLLRTILGGGPGSPASALLMRAATDPPAFVAARRTVARCFIVPRRRESQRRPASHAGSDRSAGSPVSTRWRSTEVSAGPGRRRPAGPRRPPTNVRSSALQAPNEGTHAAAAADCSQAQSIAASRPSEVKLGDSASRSARLTSASPASKYRQAGRPPGGYRQAGRRQPRLAGRRARVARANGGGEVRVGSQPLDVAAASPMRSERLWPPRPPAAPAGGKPSGMGAPDGERQIALEASVRSHLQGAEEAGKKRRAGPGRVYQALVKLGANQQTLGDNFARPGASRPAATSASSTTACRGWSRPFSTSWVISEPTSSRCAGRAV